MKTSLRVLLALGLVAAALGPDRREAVTLAQGRQEPGRSIGTVSTAGDLVVLTLDERALGAANLFDLTGRTLRFTPDGAAYRAENLALQWEPETGDEMSGAELALHNFRFPFSGKTWDAMSVGVTGSISFGAAPSGGGAGQGRGGGGRGGVTIGRFDQLQQAARTLVNTVPALCVFLKPRMSGTRSVKEHPDRVVITWSLTEPVGGIQDFTWVPTVNRFQAVLRKDGRVDFSYQEIAAKDAIIGLYPVVKTGVEKPLVSLDDPVDPDGPGHLDIRNVRVTVVDGLFLKVTVETRGPVLTEGDPALSDLRYRVAFDTSAAAAGSGDPTRAAVLWTISGVAGGRGGGGGRGPVTRYSATGPGVSPDVTVSGSTISIKGVLPPALEAGGKVAVSADVVSGSSGATGDRVAARAVTLSGIQRPGVDLSAVKRQDGPFPVLYESFHYLALPNPRDLTCTVIKALGDRFDFLAYYSDFRVDNQEAGTPSNGPLGGGPEGGAVTGIGATQRGLDSYCSQGRFQWQFVQPVYVGSNQMQERPPEGTTDTNNHNVAAYSHQLGERSPDGRMVPYNYALSQIGHEMGHRWSAFVSAKVGSETISLGPTHWARGLQAPAAFPFQRPSEASAMGGGVWQDNFDGTFTQLDDDYYVPATGWSYLDLYLMGLIGPSEVPDFFILRNLAAAGRDATGRPMFKADRTKVTIDDVIAVEGARLPDVDRSQKAFNTGMVVIVEHGKTPSRELVERTSAIGQRWIDYWVTTTGHRASMTTTPR
jgi:hypothetical protein